MERIIEGLPFREKVSVDHVAFEIARLKLASQLLDVTPDFGVGIAEDVHAELARDIALRPDPDPDLFNDLRFRRLSFSVLHRLLPGDLPFEDRWLPKRGRRMADYIGEHHALAYTETMPPRVPPTLTARTAAIRRTAEAQALQRFRFMEQETYGPQLTWRRPFGLAAFYYIGNDEVMPAALLRPYKELLRVRSYALLELMVEPEDRKPENHWRAIAANIHELDQAEKQPFGKKSTYIYPHEILIREFHRMAHKGRPGNRRAKSR